MAEDELRQRIVLARRIHAATNSYIPSHEDIVRHARMIAEDLDRLWGTGWWDASSGVCVERIHQRYYPRGGPVYAPRDIHEATEIAHRKEYLAALESLHYAKTHYRCLGHVFRIREELMEAVRRNQAIRACRGFKEELMQVAWHPNRVGRILETYGWEALDNLLGVE